ncbi:4Fe-4S dicluster domain-containing protein [Adlercreutzia sp. R25]|uniref:4Fe-4S dicluster domain-containing protein n=1 Tax=Adlercreutzia shanghongiae TaxID=3111773 RepID=A0ABU6IY94_9ACTN|nr:MULTISPECIES: 4Fe-4S dicluster domain-containing protein [unclassified Adlercreutzia]MEC4271809.1 4Fe-4S dicluster domain-containing protein [Adlercreutzia sp. R25]MEC4294816.1 4Fe-4S dicluster domain-containing protein [Adlercreutzia sp. R22]
MALGFYFRESACTGCRVCQIACQDRNDLPVNVAVRKVATFTSGSYPQAQFYHYSAACNHCADPACAAACPTGATQKSDDGTVYRDKETCIGCGSCVSACPYGHPMVDEEAGVSVRCDSCKAFRDNGENPVCVDACPMRALEFGDIEELRAKHEGENLVVELPILPSADETGPALLIDAKQCALAADYKETMI